MRALLPVYCRPLGYFIIALALFLFSHISYIECALLGIWYKESDS